VVELHKVNTAKYVVAHCYFFLAVFFAFFAGAFFFAAMSLTPFPQQSIRMNWKE
jgi:hypothetical protein